MATLEQEGYRWRLDDGNENGATWISDQDCGGSELVSNSGMEDGNPPTGWVNQDWALLETFERSATQKHGGSYSAHGVDSTPNNGGFYQTPASRIAGKNYKFSFWYYITSGSIIVVLWNGNITAQIYNSDILSTTGSWQQIEAIVTETVNGSGRLQFYNSSNSVAAEFYIDDVSVREIPLSRWRNVNTRLRMLVNATGDPGAAQFRLEYRKKGTSNWYVVNTGAESALSSPSASLSPSISPSISPSASPSLSPSASLSPSVSPSISPSVSPSVSPSISPSPSPSGGGCTSGAVDTGNDYGASIDYINADTITRGQEFLVTETKGIYSISVNVASVTTGGILELRVGESADLRTAYLATSTVNVTSTGWNEFVLSSHPTLEVNTKYYFGVSRASGSSANVGIYVDGQYDVYATGLGYTYRTDQGTQWNMTNFEALYDLQFYIYLCV